MGTLEGDVLGTFWGPTFPGWELILVLSKVCASFKFKQKITGSTGHEGTENVEIMVPLKYLSSFWGTLEKCV